MIPASATARAARRGSGVLHERRAVRQRDPPLPRDPRRPRVEQCRARRGPRRVPVGGAPGRCPRGASDPTVRLGSSRERRDRGARGGARARGARSELGCARGRPLRRRRDRRRHRRRAERARPARAAGLWAVDRQLVPRDLERRCSRGRPHGRGDDRARRVARDRPGHRFGALRPGRDRRVPIHAEGAGRHRTGRSPSREDLGVDDPDAGGPRRARGVRRGRRRRGRLVGCDLPEGRPRHGGRRRRARVRRVADCDDDREAHRRPRRRPLRAAHRRTHGRSRHRRRAWASRWRCRARRRR